MADLTLADVARALDDALAFYEDPRSYAHQPKADSRVQIDGGARARRAREIVRRFDAEEKARREAQIEAARKRVVAMAMLGSVSRERGGEG